MWHSRLCCRMPESILNEWISHVFSTGSQIIVVLRNSHPSLTILVSQEQEIMRKWDIYTANQVKSRNKCGIESDLKTNYMMCYTGVLPASQQCTRVSQLIPPFKECLVPELLSFWEEKNKSSVAQVYTGGLWHLQSKMIRWGETSLLETLGCC